MLLPEEDLSDFEDFFLQVFCSLSAISIPRIGRKGISR